MLLRMGISVTFCLMCRCVLIYRGQVLREFGPAWEEVHNIERRISHIVLSYKFQTKKGRRFLVCLFNVTSVD